MISGISSKITILVKQAYNFFTLVLFMISKQIKDSNTIISHVIFLLCITLQSISILSHLIHTTQSDMC